MLPVEMLAQLWECRVVFMATIEPWVGLNHARPVRTRTVPSSSTSLPATACAKSGSLDAAASDEVAATDLDAAEAAAAWSSTVGHVAADDFRTMART